MVQGNQTTSIAKGFYVSIIRADNSLRENFQLEARMDQADLPGH